MNSRPLVDGASRQPARTPWWSRRTANRHRTWAAWSRRSWMLWLVKLGSTAAESCVRPAPAHWSALIPEGKLRPCGTSAEPGAAAKPP